MKRILLAHALALMTGSVFAAGFVNGSFEDGTTSGWTTGTGYRGNDLNPSLTPGRFLPGGNLNDPSLNHSAIIAAGTVDPNMGAALGSTVFSGNFSFRAEDTTSGGYGSAIDWPDWRQPASH